MPCGCRWWASPASTCWPSRPLVPRLVVAAIDARRGELFTAAYRQVPGGLQRLSERRVSTPDDLAGDLEATGEDVLLVGDGGLRYRQRSTTSAGSSWPTRRWPSLRGVARAVGARPGLREDFVQPWEVEPLYLRRPDAEINWETRDGRVSERAGPGDRGDRGGGAGRGTA